MCFFFQFLYIVLDLLPLSTMALCFMSIDMYTSDYYQSYRPCSLPDFRMINQKSTSFEIDYSFLAYCTFLQVKNSFKLTCQNAVIVGIFR